MIVVGSVVHMGERVDIAWTGWYPVTGRPRRSKVEPYTHLLGKVPDKGTFLYSLTPKGRAAWQEMD